ncbi:DUF4160 domain-containing protein [Telluribacter sp.]
MFYNDHAPPHFHAEYGDEEALFDIINLDYQNVPPCWL